MGASRAWWYTNGDGASETNCRRICTPFICAALPNSYTYTLILSHTPRRNTKQAQRRTQCSPKRGKSQVECPEITFTYIHSYMRNRVNSFTSDIWEPTNMIVHFDKSSTKLSGGFFLLLPLHFFVVAGSCFLSCHGWDVEKWFLHIFRSLNIDLWVFAFFVFSNFLCVP